MRIIVPIKQVPETTNVKMDPETGTMLRSGLASIINPLDLNSLEAALQLKEQMQQRQQNQQNKDDDHEVIAISMGPKNARYALKEAIAMGCDRAFLLSDRKFSGADTWATAYVLTQAIKKIGDFDLIVCGERASDGDTGQVGPGIAAFLGLPLATYVSRAQMIAEDVVQIERLVEDGTEILRTPTPAVLTVLKEAGYPRFPTLKQKLAAEDVEIPTWGPDELETDAEKIGLKGSPTRVVKIDKPQVGRKAELVAGRDEADQDNAVQRVVDFLKERNLL